MYSIHDFHRENKLGEGTYGVVYKYRHKITNELFAIKLIKKEHCLNGVNPTTLREVTFLKQLNHPNIINLLQGLVHKGTIFMIFEYVTPDLAYFLEQNGALEFSLVKRFSYQIMQGLLYSHRKRILHRDLKPHNLLIDLEKMNIKICDFGLARAYCPPVKQYTHEVVTMYYRAPEVLLNTKRYSCGVDVWSLACIIAEMFLGHILFYALSEIEQILSIFKILGTPNEEIWPDLSNISGWKSHFPKWGYQLDVVMGDRIDEHALDLLNQMFYYYPNYRMTISEALGHKYFENLDKSDMPATDGEKMCPLIDAFNKAKDM